MPNLPSFNIARGAARFADVMPDNTLDLSGMSPGPDKTAAIERAYQDGMCGTFTTGHTNQMGAAARYFRDAFRDSAGRNQCLTAHVLGFTGSDEQTQYGYVASSDADRIWKRDRASDAQDWLFRCFQNSGCCVQDSWTEMAQGLQATRAADPENREAMKYLAARLQYAERGYCGAGWYGSECARVTLEHGYAFAFPTLAGFRYGGEQDSEDRVVKTWCRKGIPAEVQLCVDQQGWRFQPGAITEFGGDLEELKGVFRQRGQFHHGSNITSGSHEPNRLQRIGGHQQTTFGASWHPLVLKFYEERGHQLPAGDFWTFNHQTWGRGWSGEVWDRDWPYGHSKGSDRVWSWEEVQKMEQSERDDLVVLCGPLPEGAWVCSASNLLKHVEGYVYLPKFKGLPDDRPEPPEPTSKIRITTDVTCASAAPIRGGVTVEIPGETRRYFFVPAGSGTYRLQEQIV